MAHLGLCAGPLFLVAGWFSARSLARKGAGGFARARLLRLGVPLIVFIFVVNPLAIYLGNLRGTRHASLADDLGGAYGAGPMWFVAALLAFSLAYALLRRLRPAAVARRQSGARAMVAAAVLIAVTAVVVCRWSPPDQASTFLSLRWASWPQGAGLFALGAWAGETGSLEHLTAWAHRLGQTAFRRLFTGATPQAFAAMNDVLAARAEALRPAPAVPLASPSQGR